MYHVNGGGNVVGIIDGTDAVSWDSCGRHNSPSSYRSLSEDGTYWEEITNIAFYLYDEGNCSDGFYVGGRVTRSYGLSGQYL